MTKAKRWLLWGLIASPAAILPSAFVLARVWLNQHLHRELAFGDFRLRLANPNLGWNLNFISDSVEVSAPHFSLRTGRILSDIRFLNSLASLRPDISVATDIVKIGMDPDTSESARRDRKKKPRRIPAFPNLRIPFGFKVTANRLEVRVGGWGSAQAQDLALYSQGPKGMAVEASGIALHTRQDTVSIPAAYRVSARWFGKSVRYQIRAQNAAGDFVRLDGEHKKTDLREGEDSLVAGLAGLSGFASLFPGRAPPGFSNLDLHARWETGTRQAGGIKAAFTTPRVWQVGPQRVEVQCDLEDTRGRLHLKSLGLTEETVYLQGRFEIPNPDSGLARIPAGLRATLSGYSHDFRFRLGDRILPGDAEIRRLTILPGLNLEAEVRTRDSSVLRGRAFRVPDSTAGPSLALPKVPRSPAAASWIAGPAKAGAGARRDSTWKLQFTGTADPRETWMHAWVDTNVSFKYARVKGELGRNGLTVEAWVRQPRAYGAAGDSLYAVQNVNKTGYYLTGSRLYAKDIMWPITGQVEWGKRVEGKSGRRRQVSLAFRTKHPRYGLVEYAMARPGFMTVRAEKVDCQYLPYTRLRNLSALKPLLTGGFEWDWKARTGWIDAEAGLDYAGRALTVKAKADWDALLFRAKGVDVGLGGSDLDFSGSLRLGGKQFWQMGHAGLQDVQSLALRAEKFDAASLAGFLGPGFPVEQGSLNGKLSYTDTSGFRGLYQARDLQLRPLRRLMSVPRLDLIGQGESLRLTLRTASNAYPWLDDSIDIEVEDVLGAVHGVSLKAFSKDGMRLGFQGRSGQFQDLEGELSLAGDLDLPGDAGTVRDARLGGHLRLPLSREILRAMVLDSGSFAGRYAVPGLDTQSFGGTLSLRDGRLRIPDLRASTAAGVTLTGEADCDLTGGPRVTAKLHGAALALQWPGIQKLILTDADASLAFDSSGLKAEAIVGKADFGSSKPPISMHGTLENMELAYFRPPPPKTNKGSSATIVRNPELKIKAKLRNFLFKHKIGFRELQKSIRTVKSDKRKRRVKPMDVQLNLETAGSENRVETDVLRMFFVGDLAVKGVYPYTLLSGEFSALSGELGQTSQSYDITDFDLKWQNATLEEGRISVEGGKRLRSDCKPDTKRTCNVFVKLAGRLDEMAFTYDSDCGGNSGESLEPSALINSVSRGCYSGEYVAGAGGGNYGEAVFVLLEPTINEKLTSVGDRFSGGWIKNTSVSGIGTAVSGDTSGSEPVAIGVESKEKWGVSFKAKAGYHPEKKLQNPWESKAAMEWRPPLELASRNSEWKRRVRDRVTLEVSAESRPEEKATEQNRQVRGQVGIRYRYKFWDLW